MADFTLDPRLTATSAPVTDLPLCHVRLALDARWPWLLLIPRRDGLTELTDLAEADRPALWTELDRAAVAVRALGNVTDFPVAKLNIGALGNVVPQLHIHVVGRGPGDPAWPGPVWGAGDGQPYAPDRLEAVLSAARGALA